MLETAYLKSEGADRYANNGGPRKILKMRQNDRMAGSVPAWEKAPTAKDKIIERLSYATPAPKGISKALAYANASRHGVGGEKPFGFGDLVDMVNPLQHIPLVNSLYREVSGDEIRPVSRVVGGAIYGGPIGAASGMVNVLIEQETGKDLTGNLIAMAQRSERTSPATSHPAEGKPIALTEIEELPNAVVRYVDLGSGKRRVIRQEPDSHSRMAGSVTRIYTEITKPKKEQVVDQVVAATLPESKRIVL